MDAETQDLLERLKRLEEQVGESSSDEVEKKPTPPSTPLANPSPVGLLGFAVVSWLSGVTKLLSDGGATTDGLLAATAIFIGGLSQVFAGLLQFPKNHTHSATVFLFFGMHWTAQGVILILRNEGILPPQFSDGSEIAYFVLLTVTTIILTIPTLRMNLVLTVTLSFVVLVFACDAWAAAGSPVVRRAAGVLSCIAATGAFYMCLLDLVNEAWGAAVLPLFPHDVHKRDYTRGWRYIPRLHFHKPAVAGPNV